MPAVEIDDLRRIFTTRLETLDHILAVAAGNLADGDAALQQRLAPDMFPLGTQVAFACNQPRNFARWCAGQPAEDLDAGVATVADARACIRATLDLLASARADDRRLAETRRTDLAPGVYCETSARLYVSDFLVPNFYFHIAMAYAILRHLGVPLGKADYMQFLLPHIRQQQP